MASVPGFLRIPPELRNSIYDLCHEEQSDYLSTLRITKGRVILHPLTRTCQQIALETRAVFQPVDMSRTDELMVQVFDFEFDNFHSLLLDLHRHDNRTRNLHVELMFTAPGAEDMQQLRRWLGHCKTSLSRASDPLRGYNRIYSAKIDWTVCNLAGVNGIVQALLNLKSGGLKSIDTSSIHYTLANAAKKQSNKLAGKQPTGRAMIGVMGSNRGGGV